jgi:peroxiredoxin Q/BCP
VLACSADPPETMAKFRSRFKINFPLLSDPEFQAIETYGARRMKTFLGKSFLGIVRSTFWIGPDGKIRKVWDKVSPKGHAPEVLEAIEKG